MSTVPHNQLIEVRAELGRSARDDILRTLAQREEMAAHLGLIVRRAEEVRGLMAEQPPTGLLTTQLGYRKPADQSSSVSELLEFANNALNSLSLTSDQSHSGGILTIYGHQEIPNIGLTIHPLVQNNDERVFGAHRYNLRRILPSRNQVVLLREALECPTDSGHTQSFVVIALASYGAVYPEKYKNYALLRAPTSSDNPDEFRNTVEQDFVQLFIDVSRNTQLG